MSDITVAKRVLNSPLLTQKYFESIGFKRVKETESYVKNINLNERLVASLTDKDFFFKCEVKSGDKWVTDSGVGMRTKNKDDLASFFKNILTKFMPLIQKADNIK